MAKEQIVIRGIKFTKVFRTRRGKTHELHRYTFPKFGSKVKDYVTGFIHEIRPRLDKTEDMDVNDSPGPRLANMRWEAIRPHYEAWLKNQELPETGTSLEAFSALDEHQIEQLKQHNIRSIEDLASMPDGMINGIRMSGLYRLKAAAKAFLESREKMAVFEDVEQAQHEIADLRKQNAEMLAMLEELTKDKPKRGRPPKQRDEPELSEADGSVAA